MIMDNRPDEQEPEAPRWVPYTPPAADGWDRVWLVLRRLSFPAVLLLFGVGLVAVFYWGEQRTVHSRSSMSVDVMPLDGDRSGGSGDPSSGRTRLVVRSEPEGAVVRVNGDSVGTTPLTDPGLRPGAYMLSVQAPGYLRTDTVLVLNGDTEARLQFVLRTRPGRADPVPSASQSQAAAVPAPDTATQPTTRPLPAIAVPESADEAPDPSSAYGTLYVTSTPLGAVVTVAGTERGRTPLSVEPVAVGEQQVRLAIEGYEPWTAQVNVQTDSTHRMHAELAQKTGRLRVLARPWGTLYINGTLHARETDVWYETQVPVGTHRVTAVHPALGTQAQTVEVRADEETSIVLNLQDREPDDSSL